MKLNSQLINQLVSYGISNIMDVRYNPSYDFLYEEELSPRLEGYDKGCLSISANGANTGATFYQSKKFTVLQGAYAIKWGKPDCFLTDNLEKLFGKSTRGKRLKSADRISGTLP